MAYLSMACSRAGCCPGVCPRRDNISIFARSCPVNGENLALVEKMGNIARRIGATPVQLAIAWICSRGEDVFPLVGARRLPRLEESSRALQLNGLDMHEFEVAIRGVAGSRYSDEHMAGLDSERMTV